jgi:hypothetical protein
MIIVNHITETSIFIQYKSSAFTIGVSVDDWGYYYVYCSPTGLNKYIVESQICFLEKCEDWRKEAFKLIPLEVKSQMKFITF